MSTMNAKKTTKYDVKFKDLTFFNGEFVEYTTGEIVDVVGYLEKLFNSEDKLFDLSVTSSDVELIDLEKLESEDFDE